MTEETEKSMILRDEYGRFLKGTEGPEKRYRTAQELLEVAKEYFDMVLKEKRPATMSGLALALGFRSRKALLHYQRSPGYEEFHDALAFLKLKLEMALEERMLDSDNRNIAGTIFNAKNNFDFADKTEVTMESRNMNLTGFTLVNPNDDGRTT